MFITWYDAQRLPVEPSQPLIAAWTTGHLGHEYAKIG